MGKLKKIFSNISNSIKETYKKFPITIIIVYIITFIYAFGTDEFINNFEKEEWLAVLIIWAIGTLFVETWTSKKSMRVVGIITTFGISLGFREILNSETILFEDFFQRLLATYIMILPLLTLYKTIKNLKVEVKEYGLKVLSNFGKCSTIYILANLGILLVLFVFIELILNGNDGDIIYKTLILLLGCYYVPSLINAVTDMSSEVGKFIKVLIMYVFTPVGTFLIGILYMYIIKIIINGELLHNEIFFILSLTFAVMVPVVLLLKNYDENGKIKKFTNVLIYLFIPFIFLQIFAMGTRISEYGITESRYMAILLIIVEIVLIALILIKNSKHLDKIILFVAVLTVISILSPLNIENVTRMSQINRAKNIIDRTGNFSTLTDKEKEECKKAIIFIDSDDNRKYILEKIDQETLNEIEDYQINYYDNYDYEYGYVYAYESIDGVNIEEYRTIYKLYEKSYNQKDYGNYQIKSQNDEIIIGVDFKNLIEQMIKADSINREDEIFELHRWVDTNNENIKIYLTAINISYEKYTNEIESFSVDGYILVK